MKPGRTVTVRIRCPRGECRQWHRIALDGAEIADPRCPACGDPIPLVADAGPAEARPLTRCPACDGVEFFIRRDFPQRIGLLLVILFGLVASVFFYFSNVVATFATLASLVVIDALIFAFVGKVTICYRCRAELRNVAYNPGHTGFDLATSEKYG